ncbi:hypothetical protein [Marinobacter adhaerens]|jgi:hypothetical protein|uniref:RIFT barrel domain-containing protein n=1 Tax=Marinobacter adhaerens TaxID=1033846 RepID=UPI003BABA58A
MDMEPINIHLNEHAGIARSGEPIQLGVPISKGTLQSHEKLQLINSSNNEVIKCQSEPMVFWPDGSVRWLKLSFLVSQAPSTDLTLNLTKADAEADQQPSPIQYRFEEDILCVTTGLSEFRFPMGELRWDTSQGEQAPAISQEVAVTTTSGEHCSTVMDTNWHVTEAGPISATVSAEGSWQAPDQTRLARFRFSLRLFANSPTVELQTCIHNPRRAQHPGGLWDLGDLGSIYFRALTVHARLSNASKTWLTPGLDQPKLESDAGKQLYLYQDSSGGDHWHSRNHINAEGRITTSFRGYRVHNADELIQSGDRASPIAGMSNQAGQYVQGSMKHFWQNFPSAIGTKENVLILGLFPADTAYPYELQGGERKTQTAWLHYGENSSALYWTQAPLVPTLDPEHYEKTDAFDWFETERPRDLLDDLIQEGLDGESNFFAKREVIDEYGWRNFGDIFADHETLYQADGESPYISHYNNQYDAIYGFARQFALSGDRRWFELMDDLARHVSDIDIYHTEEDRSEYNNGLFWHTDHYLDAHTSTHRTFTRHNETSSTPGQTGGGPAAEHCYTTGFLYHYLMTGNEDSREAVFDLVSWMVALHEGEGGFFEQVFALKKYELPKLQAFLKGQSPTVHRFPFTRGTGNYLNALMDAWLLDPSGLWLSKAENVLDNTIHPSDDIQKRDLLSIETGWSYLILLTSVARYLRQRHQLIGKDEHWSYINLAFLHYIEWMEQNETLFLSASERLEYPNATWAAQDIRKSSIMFRGAVSCPEKYENYAKKGKIWFDNTLTYLANSHERHYSRVQIILLQNHGFHRLRDVGTFNKAQDQIKNQPFGSPNLKWSVLFRRIFFRLIRALITFSPSREVAWLKTRLK